MVCWLGQQGCTHVYVFNGCLTVRLRGTIKNKGDVSPLGLTFAELGHLVPHWIKELVVARVSRAIAAILSVHRRVRQVRIIGYPGRLPIGQQVRVRPLQLAGVQVNLALACGRLRCPLSRGGGVGISAAAAAAPFLESARGRCGCGADLKRLGLLRIEMGMGGPLMFPVHIIKTYKLQARSHIVTENLYLRPFLSMHTFIYIVVTTPSSV